MAPTIFRLMLLLGIGLAAVDVAEAGAKVITTMRFPMETFTNDLLNSTTDAYKNLTARIEDKVFNAMKGKNADIIGLKVNGYTNGSIIVNATVELAATVDPATVNTAQLVKNATTAIANDATFTDFKIDSTSITTTAQPTSTTTVAPGATTAATTTAATGSNTTTTASSATTTAAPAGSNTTTTAAAGAATTTTAAVGGTTTAAAAGAATTTAAAGAATTTAAAAGAATTTAAAGAATTTAAAGAATTTAASVSGGTATTTRSSTSGSTVSGGTATTTRSSTSGSTASGTSSGTSTGATGGSAGASGATGTSGTAGSSSTGTASSNSTANATARIPVKVDETSLGGMAVIIALSKTGLPSVTPYIDITKPEYGNLMGALPALNNMLRGTSEAAHILTNVELKQVIVEDSATIRAEYLAHVAKETTLPPLQAGMDSLNKMDVFKIDGTTHRVEFVPLTIPNRWHSLRLRLPSKIFTPELKDPSFAQFKGLQTEIQQQLTDILRAKVPSVRAAYIQEFTSGSVIVRASVETDNTSSSVTTTNLANALSTVDTVGPYNVDTDAKSKSVTGETYIYGAHVVQPVPESQLPVRTPLTRDTENIKKGQVSIEDENANKVAIRRTNYFFTVTIPSFAAVLVLIILFLCCTTSDSCLCKICSNDPKSVP